MKILLAAALLFCSFGAAAETITLGPDECGIIKQCIDIPDDAGAQISLYGAPQYPWFYVYIDGVQFYAPVPSGYVMDNVEMQSFILPDPTNPLVKQFTGKLFTISGTFSTYRTCTRSGRGQTCSTHWNLTGGTVTR